MASEIGKEPALKSAAKLAPRVAPSTAEDVECGGPLLGVVGVGASVGGIEAFTAFLAALPPVTGFAFVFIQHPAPTRVSMPAETLRRATVTPVTEVRDETLIRPDHVYVVPPDQFARVNRGILYRSPAQGLEHRSIDRFFTALAHDQGHRSIGIVLSGAATDGVLGLKAIKAAGGITFAQDASAQHHGMPDSAISGGCVDLVLPPTQIAAEIAALSAYLAGRAANVFGTDPPEDERVLAILRQRSGIDLAQYKRNILHRSIRRRMALSRVPTMPEYTAYLQANAQEVEALIHSIFIGATSFFRDPEAFRALQQKVFPALFANRSRHDPLRVWVPGCATGEEAYSLAIALTEYARSISSVTPVVVYATDLNTFAIERSRAAWYPRAIAMDVSRERLQRFFVEAEGGYRIAKSIRDLCVFARHNALTDPPFSRMDLIGCRDLLIHMEPVLQKRLMPALHYALKSAGFLFLGPSELPVTGTDCPQDAERALVAPYVPPAVLVNQEMEILQICGETAAALDPEPSVGRVAAANAKSPVPSSKSQALREREAEFLRLETELAATREYLQSVIEQQAEVNKELRSANEEVQAANEELQSITEELETSQEEIRARNEELTMLNKDLRDRNTELNRLNKDLSDLFDFIPVAMVIVWRDLRIRSFTPLGAKLLHLISADVGRPISDLELKFGALDLVRILIEVIDSTAAREQEVRDSSGRWFHLQVQPCKTPENQIDGAILMLRHGRVEGVGIGLTPLAHGQGPHRPEEAR